MPIKIIKTTHALVMQAVKKLKDRPIVLAYEVWTPLQTITHLAPFNEDTMKLKLEALAEHRSQVDCINFENAISSLNRYRGVLMYRSDYAECFQRIDIENEQSTYLSLDHAAIK